MKLCTEKQHVWELCDQHVQGLRLDRLAVAAKVQSFTEAGLLLYDIQHDRNRLAQIRPLGGALWKTVPSSHEAVAQGERKIWFGFHALCF